MPFAEKLKSALRPAINERKKVEQEIKKTDWFKEFVAQYGEEPNLSESADYDYFTAWKMGVRPERDPNDENRFHWGSYAENKFGRKVLLKKAGHKTLWKTRLMEETGINPDEIGIKNEQQGQQWLESWRARGAATRRLTTR